MALRFYDGFDHYPAAEMLNKWTSWSNTGIAFVSGRYAGSTAVNTNARSFSKSIDAQSEWIVGFAFKHLGATGQILRLFNGATLQDDLFFDAATNRFSVRRAGSTVLGTGTKQLQISVWHYVELRIVLSDTVGVVNLKVDGVDDINLTGQDTINSGATSDGFTFGDGGVPSYIDDLYICDASGAAPYNTFLNDPRVEVLYPTGNGASSQWVGQDADSVDNYLLVDETDSDDDTTYVESSTVGNKDTYAYGNLTPASGTVFAVQILPWAKKTDAGSRAIKTVARLAAGTEQDSAAISLPSTYTYVAQDIRTAKPGGGVWSVSDVNGAEFGYKVDS